MSCAEMAQLIHLPVLVVDSGWTKGTTSSVVFARWCQYALMGGHHLANTIEPYICGGDAGLCQITLTTCFLFRSQLFVSLNLMSQ